MKLAIDGGTPVRDSLLSYGRQSICDADVNAVAEALRKDFLTTGPIIEEFETAVAEFVGAKHAVAFANGTAALHGAYFAAGVRAGDEIVTTGMTFAATGNAALYLGAQPCFVDIDPKTGCIDASSVAARVSARTKAIVGIDYSGHPCEVDDLRATSESCNLKLIVDGAHSLGALYRGRKVGSLADMTTFSFHPVKAITTGEGGMVVTNDSELYHKLVAFRTHGIVKSIDDLENKSEGSWYHEMQFLGFNYRITDFQCALGLQQLKRLPQFIERRREIASLYRDRLSKLEGFAPIHEFDHCQSAYHLFPVIVTKEPRARFRKMVFDALRAENIGVQVHYIPVYQHPYYKRNVESAKTVECPETDSFYNGEISLPMFPDMTDSDVDDVIEALEKIEAGLLQGA